MEKKCEEKCKEIKSIISDREKLEASLGANLPGINVDEIENQINEIDNSIELEIIKLKVFSKKRTRQRFSRKLPK